MLMAAMMMVVVLVALVDLASVREGGEEGGGGGVNLVLLMRSRYPLFLFLISHLFRNKCLLLVVSFLFVLGISV